MGTRPCVWNKEFGSIFGAIAWLYRLPLPLLAKRNVKVVIEVRALVDDDAQAKKEGDGWMS